MSQLIYVMSSNYLDHCCCRCMLGRDASIQRADRLTASLNFNMTSYETHVLQSDSDELKKLEQQLKSPWKWGHRVKL